MQTLLPWLATFEKKKQTKKNQFFFFEFKKQRKTNISIFVIERIFDMFFQIVFDVQREFFDFPRKNLRPLGPGRNFDVLLSNAIGCITKYKMSCCALMFSCCCLCILCLLLYFLGLPRSSYVLTVVGKLTGLVGKFQKEPDITCPKNLDVPISTCEPFNRKNPWWSKFRANFKLGNTKKSKN